MKFALLFLPLLAQAEELSLTLRQYHDVLPKNGALECRMAGDPSFGYVIRRGADDRVRTYVINNHQNEGEKTAQDGTYMNPAELTYAYVKHHQRAGDFGSYFEFVVSKQPDGKTFDFPGFVMFTEAYYAKNDEGQEVEELMPLAKSPVRCKTLR